MDMKLGHSVREERRLKVFENGVLRGIFAARREKRYRGVEKTT